MEVTYRPIYDESTGSWYVDDGDGNIDPESGPYPDYDTAQDVADSYNRVDRSC